jgi:Aspartyl protease
MPSYNILPPVHNQPNANFCQLQTVFGPIIQAELAVPDALATVLTSNGNAVPSPVVGNALIDTGASICCIDEEHAINLGLQPVGQISLGNAGGARVHERYIGKISFPGTTLQALEFVLVGCPLRQQGLLMLIGRDVLQSCVLIYNGPLGITTISI